MVEPGARTRSRDGWNWVSRLWIRLLVRAASVARSWSNGGIVWARRWLDCALVHRDGTRLGHRRIVYAETTDPVDEYLRFLRDHNRTRWQAIPTAIEDTNLLFVEGLVDRGMEVVHIDATRASRARKAASVGRNAKSDKGDAFLLAEMLRSRTHQPCTAVRRRRGRSESWLTPRACLFGGLVG